MAGGVLDPASCQGVDRASERFHHRRHLGCAEKKEKDVMSKDGCETTYSPAGGLLVNHKSLAVRCVLSCHRWSFILKRSMINIYKIDLFI